MAALKAGVARRAPVAGRPGALRLDFHLERGMRVGLFGGSFDPPHAGHAHVAETALLRLGLDRVIWLVSPGNPLKAGSAPLAGRLEAARELAAKAAGGRAMIVSAAEGRLGSRYTIDTVRVLQARFPGVRFVWIMGGDNLAQVHRWRGWTQLFASVPIAVVARPGALLEGRFSPAARRFAARRLPGRAARLLPIAAPPAWTYLRAPLNPASSTALRDRAGADDPEPRAW